jgi:Na+/proline symporter
MWIVIPGLLMIGVGLYAYFSAHPGELGDGNLSQILAGDSKVADEAMPGFVRLHFPPGMAGLFLAALMAAIMSSIDSGVHSVTTALLVDFRDRLFPQFRPVDERTEMRRIRLLIVIIGSIAIALACFAGSMGNVFAVSKKLTAAFGGPLLALFVLGLFSRRANWQPILLSVAFATVMTLCLMYTQDWFAMWYWPIGFGTALGLGYLTSLLRPVQATEFTYAKIIRNYERDQT